jgi:2-polyprenyl-3-methyl-5-hydroxy-6-metoxy-1,4-benzoquinol methylase
MANPDRAYDKTHLSIDTAEERMIQHRDYIAHAFRWSHICKFLMQRKRYATARILEAGCGRELPLPRLIYSNRMSGAKYVGIDMNPLTVPDMIQKAADSGKMGVWLMPHTDAGCVKLEHLPWQPNILVCLEVFEHVHPAFGLRMLRNLLELAEDGADFFFSTPCFNGSAADNHISETSYTAMGSILERVGWNIDLHYGTFASQADYLPHMTADVRWIFEALSHYYDSNVLSVIFAPLFPEYSRNCLWHCRKESVVPKFPLLEDLPQPWGQHRDSNLYAE